MVSVLQQKALTAPLVVLDRPERADAVRDNLAGLHYTLVTTRGLVGGGAARNLGVLTASTEYVAFLDDDDEWLPDKSSIQVGALESGDLDLVSCRSELVGSSVRVVPEVLFDGSTSMSSYLLDRSTVRLRRHFLQSSSLLLRRDVALAHPWREDLARHQDWDFLITASRSGVVIGSVEDILVRVYQGSHGSVSNSTDWRTSLAWLEESAAEDATTRAKGDFLASIVLRSALAAGEWTTVPQILAKAIRSRCHASALMAGLTALLPR